MKRIQKIVKTKPLKVFDETSKFECLKHLNEDLWLYEPGTKRYICSLLGVLHQELEGRPDLQDLILECVWMARRMNDTRSKQDDMWSPNDLQSIENATFTRHIHSGELGDIIYALPTLRAIGSVELLLCKISGTAERGIDRAKAESMLPLLSIQPYLVGARYLEHVDLPDRVDHRLNYFRRFIGIGLNLADMHLKTHALPFNERDNAWLTIDFENKVAPIVIHRSPRYNNINFPWKQVIEKYKGHLVMVGSIEEWTSFIAEYGYVPYFPTKHLLELARVIAGCKLFIGNQSCPEAICEALKKRKILEVSSEFPDSCRFDRMDATYISEQNAYELPEIRDI